MIRSDTTLASRGRSSGSTARQSLTSVDQLPLGPAAVQPVERIGCVALSRLAEDLAGIASREGRRTRDDLAEDRAQREDVGPFVDHASVSPRACSGGM